MPEGQEKKVEYLELIYDLIFVYLIGRNKVLSFQCVGRDQLLCADVSFPDQYVPEYSDQCDLCHGNISDPVQAQQIGGRGKGIECGGDRSDACSHRIHRDRRKPRLSMESR